MIAKRPRRETASRKSSSRLPARSVNCSDRPVTLPPGRDKTCDQAATERVRRHREDDWNDRSRLLCRCDCASLGDNDIDFEPDKFRGDLGVALARPSAQRYSYRNGATVDPAEFVEPLNKSIDPSAMGCRRARGQQPDGRQLARLLRARRKRPSRRRAAEQRDELAPLHSITSSVRASSDVGTFEAERLGGLAVDHQLELGRRSAPAARRASGP